MLCENSQIGGTAEGDELVCGTLEESSRSLDMNP